jgi:hypothetical protein
MTEKAPLLPLTPYFSDFSDRELTKEEAEGPMRFEGGYRRV